jgi:hypothetical protein
MILNPPPVVSASFDKGTKTWFLTGKLKSSSKRIQLSPPNHAARIETNCMTQGAIASVVLRGGTSRTFIRIIRYGIFKDH